jgi:twitching motility protein PilI
MSATVSTLTVHTPRSRRIVGEPFLRFQLAPDTGAILEMTAIEEVRVLSSKRLTPMPNMPTAVLGLMSHRSRIRWVVDVAQLLGLPPLETNLQQYDLLLLKVSTISFGVVVQRIENTVWFPPAAVQIPSETTETPSPLTPFLRGCVLQDQRILWVLNAAAIAEAVMNLPHLP